MIISIDGPAGSGKSTVAQILADELKFLHFNSGSLYRAVTAYLLSNDFDVKNIKIDTKFENINLKIRFYGKNQHVLVNGVDYYSQLRENNISIHTPFVSTNRDIRKIIDDCQRAFCSKHNIVIEGRDIGSHVFPDAEYKFYLDCAVEERARRRFKEEQQKNSNVTIEELIKQIKERDEIDKTKKIAPLVVPKNAIMIDSTKLTIEQVVDEMHKYINIRSNLL